MEKVRQWSVHNPPLDRVTGSHASLHAGAVMVQMASNSMDIIYTVDEYHPIYDTL